MFKKILMAAGVAVLGVVALVFTMGIGKIMLAGLAVLGIIGGGELAVHGFGSNVTTNKCAVGTVRTFTYGLISAITLGLLFHHVVPVLVLGAIAGAALTFWL